MEDNKCHACGAVHGKNTAVCETCGSPLENKATKKDRNAGGLRFYPFFHKTALPLISFIVTVLFFKIVPSLFGPASYAHTLFQTTGTIYQRAIPFLAVYFGLWSLLQLLVIRLMPDGKAPFSFRVDVSASSDSAGMNRKSTFYHLMPPVGGFFIALLFLKFVSLAFGANAYLYRLFLASGDPYQGAIRFVPLFLCFWSFLHLIYIKLLPLIEERTWLKTEFISSLPRLVKDEGVKATLDKIIADNNIIRGMLFTRVSSLLEELDSSGDVQRGHELFRHQSEIDSDTVASEYSSVRLFVWAMPIIGFIGTVVGISMSVGSFSSFLGGSIDDIEMVKRELAKVSTGLSYAFDTTLLGLSTAVLTMTLSAFVQKREERFLNDLDLLCLQIVTNYQSETPSADVLRRIPYDILKRSTESFKQEIKTLTGELSQNVKSFSDNFDVTLQYLSKMSQDFAQVADKMRRDGEDVGVLVGDMHNFSRVLVSVLENNDKQFKEFYTSFSGHVQPLHATLNANIQTLSTLHAVNPVLTEMQSTLNKMIPLLHNLNGPFEFRVVPSQHGAAPGISANPQHSEVKEDN